MHRLIYSLKTDHGGPVPDLCQTLPLCQWTSITPGLLYHGAPERSQRVSIYSLRTICIGFPTPCKLVSSGSSADNSETTRKFSICYLAGGRNPRNIVKQSKESPAVKVKRCNAKLRLHARHCFEWENEFAHLALRFETVEEYSGQAS